MVAVINDLQIIKLPDKQNSSLCGECGYLSYLEECGRFTARIELSSRHQTSNSLIVELNAAINTITNLH